MKNVLKFFTTSIIFGFILSVNALAQTPSNIEAAEYDSVNNRWFVSCGSSTLLSTSDLGESWDYFGNAQASHGMEVMGNVLFVLYNNQIRSYDLSSGDLLGSTSVAGASFLNGMGNDGVSTLIISDFSSGRILKVDASNPADMVSITLVGNTGTTPNGVVVDESNGRAIIVNWGGNADILAVDIESGELTTLVSGTGLGNCDGIDMDALGRYYVSSWSPPRITRFSADFTESETVVDNGLNNPADISFDEINNVLGVANSGSGIVTFHQFINASVYNQNEIENENTVELNGRYLIFNNVQTDKFRISAFAINGKLLGETQLDLPKGSTRVAIDRLPNYFREAAIIRVNEHSFKLGLRQF
ncbi:MAG: hypothetical protein COA49_06260 [Bacteroidetes bacterium]|nr:MAG: hypothetical protein COA49_06260 [Bacteroidota bacterium]